MRIRECLHLLVMGYESEEVVIRMELTESEAKDIAIKVGSWLDEIQWEASARDRYKRF